MRIGVGLAPGLIRRGATLSGPPSWVTALDPDAIAAWDFAGDQSWVQGVEGDALDGLVSYTGGPGMAQDLAGTWSSFGSNVLRRTNKGVLIEPARTNSIDNSAGGGALAGTPGTIPTGWTMGSVGTLTRTIHASGTVDGLDYFELSLAGTTSNTGVSIDFTTSTAVVAASGQTWTLGPYLQLVSGAWTGINSVTPTIVERTSGGSYVIDGGGGNGKVGGTLTQVAYTRTLSGGGTVARVMARLNILWSNGASVPGARIRIALPQLSQTSQLLSPIRTTNAAVTRAADVPRLKDPGGTFEFIITFDDDSTQGFTNQSGEHDIPATLNRPTIKHIVAVPWP